MRNRNGVAVKEADIEMPKIVETDYDLEEEDDEGLDALIDLVEELVPADDGTDDPTVPERDINDEEEIRDLLTRRKPGRPHDTPDAKIPVESLGGVYRKAEIVAALTHLYYMQGGQFTPDDMPMHYLQKIFNVARHTMYRCVDDVNAGKVLAIRVRQELLVVAESIARAKRARERKARQKFKESQARIMSRRILERELRKAGNLPARDDADGDLEEMEEMPEITPVTKPVSPQVQGMAAAKAAKVAKKKAPPRRREAA